MKLAAELYHGLCPSGIFTFLGKPWYRPTAVTRLCFGNSCSLLVCGVSPPPPPRETEAFMGRSDSSFFFSDEGFSYNPLKIEVFVQTLLHLASKSFSHSFSALGK